MFSKLQISRFHNTQQRYPLFPRSPFFLTRKNVVVFAGRNSVLAPPITKKYEPKKTKQVKNGFISILKSSILRFTCKAAGNKHLLEEKS